MGWIKCDHDLWDKPEVIQIAECLGVSENEVVGALLKVWVWADKHTENGNAPSVTKTFLNRYSGVTNFAECMEKVGWLSSENGGICIPNFERHNGEGTKKRIQNAARQAKFKGQKEGNEKVTHEALPERYQKRKESINTPISPFKAPTEDECVARAKLVGMPEIEGRKFFAFYESKGWLVGKNKMRDWRVAMGGWKLRNSPQVATAPATTLSQAREAAR
jgi:hypothetical protein